MTWRAKILVTTVIAALLLSAAPQTNWGGGASAAGNPFDGIKWVPNVPDNVKAEPGLGYISQHQFVDWVGGWFPASQLGSVVPFFINRIADQGGTPIFAVYNIPQRDCGGFSGGGAANSGEYRAWIDSFASAIGTRKVILLIEPDSLVLICDGLDVAERHRLLAYAVDVFKRNPNAAVYLDGANHEVRTPSEIATALNAAGIARADGFFLNSTLYYHTSTEVAYGRAVSGLVGGKHFIVDTSRNGLGPWNDGPEATRWCNAIGRALGVPPTTATGDPLVDAFIWIKPVWQSDGECTRGNPATSQDYFDYARGLTERSFVPFSDLPTADVEATMAIQVLTRYGFIRGNGDGTFGSNSPTLRAQMAALIARPLYWELENHNDANFPDKGIVDNDLWRNVRTLAHYNVALGYEDGTYNPTGEVLYVQTILFISRAMIQAKFWDLQPDNAAYYPNLPGNTAREKQDRAAIATYVFYTQRYGGVPDRPATGNFTDYDKPAPRSWFTIALYRALKTAYLPAQ